MNHFWNKIIAGLTMICLLASFVGCLPEKPEQPASSSEELSSQRVPVSSEPPAQEESTSEAARPEPSSTPERPSLPEHPHKEPSSEETPRSEPCFSLLPERDRLSLAYTKLNAEEQRMYRQLIDGASRLESPIHVGRGQGGAEVNATLIQTLYSCIRADFPELFYVKGATYEVRSKEILFYPQYDGSRAEIEARLKAVQQAADRWMDDAVLKTDYEKSKWVYEQVILHTAYGGKGEDGQTVESVFLHGRSVCAGYASAAVYLLHRLGVPATVVHGVVTEDETPVNHAWVLLQLDGESYHMDPTWGDTAEEDRSSSISYMFLNVTDRLLSPEGRHQLQHNGFPIPPCTSTLHNYFVMEGLRVAHLSEEHFCQVLTEQLNKQQLNMTVYLPNEAPESWKGEAGSRKYALLCKAAEQAVRASALPCKDPEQYEISVEIYGDLRVAEVEFRLKDREAGCLEVSAA